MHINDNTWSIIFSSTSKCLWKMLISVPRTLVKDTSNSKNILKCMQSMFEK
jgi:hypothetical protein